MGQTEEDLKQDLNQKKKASTARTRFQVELDSLLKFQPRIRACELSWNPHGLLTRNFFILF